MTRPIKFRAWDTKNEVWTFATLGDLICGACKPDGDKPLSGAKQIWEQSTGLKDKNGKEIYAGDIVKLDDLNGENLDEPVKIVFEGSAFIMRCVKHNSIIIDEYGTPWVIGLMTEGIFEVIGNIHENPELLEGKKRYRKEAND